MTAGLLVLVVVSYKKIISHLRHKVSRGGFQLISSVSHGFGTWLNRWAFHEFSQRSLYGIDSLFSIVKVTLFLWALFDLTRWFKLSGMLWNLWNLLSISCFFNTYIRKFCPVIVQLQQDVLIWNNILVHITWTKNWSNWIFVLRITYERIIQFHLLCFRKKFAKTITKADFKVGRKGLSAWAKVPWLSHRSVLKWSNLW